MKKSVIRIAAIASAASALALAGMGAANAQANGDIVGGRERVKVAVNTNETVMMSCDAYIDDALRGTVFVPAAGAGKLVIEDVAAGPRKVRVVCTRGSGGTSLFDERFVEVAPADPILDAIDPIFGAVGSSFLSTDPALR